MTAQKTIEAPKRVFLRNGSEVVMASLPHFDHRGVGVFETFRARCVRQGQSSEVAIAGLSRHLERLMAGASALKCVQVDEAHISALLEAQLLRHPWNLTDDLIVRVVVCEQDWYLWIEPWNARFSITSGITLAIQHSERPWPEHKHCSALVSALAARAARNSGADEALLVDRSGIVREGAWSSFFWVDSSGRLNTAETQILPGITRGLVIELAQELEIVVFLRDVPLEQVLSEMKEAFITHATHGVVPVAQCGGVSLTSLGSQSVTGQLRDRYEQLFKSEDDERVWRVRSS